MVRRRSPPVDNFSIATHPLGQPWVSYTKDDQLWIATKPDFFWDNSVVGDITECGRTDLAIGADNIPHIAYCHDDSGVDKVFYAVRNGPGETWLLHEIDRGTKVSMSLDANGDPHLAYITVGSNPARRDLKYATTVTLTPVQIKSWGELKTLFGRGLKKD